MSYTAFQRSGSHLRHLGLNLSLGVKVTQMEPQLPSVGLAEAGKASGVRTNTAVKMGRY